MGLIASISSVTLLVFFTDAISDLSSYGAVASRLNISVKSATSVEGAANKPLAEETSTKGAWKPALKDAPEVDPEGGQAPVIMDPVIRPYRQDITRGDTGRSETSLTFDAGGYESVEETLKVLDTLKEKGVKTTIFLTGTFIKRFPSIVKRMVSDGHEIGNHMMTHPHLTEWATAFRQTTLKGVTREMVARELNEAARAFKEATGEDMAPVWRAPYGEVNGDIIAWAYEAGYAHIGWTADYERGESLDTLDWVYDRTSPLYRSTAQMKRRILSFGKNAGGLNGGIILMHMGSERKFDKASSVLGEIIEGIESKGLRLVKVSSLLSDTRPIEALKERGRFVKVASSSDR